MSCRIVSVAALAATASMLGFVPAAAAFAGETVPDLAPVGSEVSVSADDRVDDDGHDQGSGDSTEHGSESARLGCADIDPSWAELGLGSHPVSGTYSVSDDLRTVQFVVRDAPVGGKLVDWSSDGPVAAVVVRSGEDASTYEYEPPATSDTGLLPPLRDREGRNLASVVACYAPVTGPAGLDLLLVDTSDPVEVGATFEYLVSVSSVDPVQVTALAITLAPQLELVEAPGCVGDDTAVHCTPLLDPGASWQQVITVTATAAGDAVTRAELVALSAEEEVRARAVEVTRIIGGPGGGCGGHDGDDGHDAGHDTAGDDEHGDTCPGPTAELHDACLALAPTARGLVLTGPFVSGDHLLDGDDGTSIVVTFDEATGQQVASWVATVPIDLVLARTGRDVATFPSDPAATTGTGVVGPPGGSGAPRPIADMAFCWVPVPKTDDVDEVPQGDDSIETGIVADVEETASTETETAAGPELGDDRLEPVVLSAVVDDELPAAGIGDARMLVLSAGALFMAGVAALRAPGHR